MNCRFIAKCFRFPAPAICVLRKTHRSKGPNGGLEGRRALQAGGAREGGGSLRGVKDCQKTPSSPQSQVPDSPKPEHPLQTQGPRTGSNTRGLALRNRARICTHMGTHAHTRTRTHIHSFIQQIVSAYPVAVIVLGTWHLPSWGLFELRGSQPKTVVLTKSLVCLGFIYSTVLY